MKTLAPVSAFNTLVTDRDVLVLSPHLDDAMLSASAIVLNHACEVWTVFTGRPIPPQATSWDLSCGFTDSDETITARKAEDEAAFVGTPARTRHLDFLDGAYASRDEHRTALPIVQQEIDVWMTAHPHGMVVVPAGAGIHVPPSPWERVLGHLRRIHSRSGGVQFAEPRDRDGGLAEARAEEATASAFHPARTPASGAPSTVQLALARAKQLLQHALHAEHLRRRRKAMGAGGLAANPDHLALRDTALTVAARHPEVGILLFEDLPYLWHARGDAEVARLSEEFALSVERVSVDVDTKTKQAHLSAYASQMPVMDSAGRLMHHETLPRTEVYWLISSNPRRS